MIEGVPSGPNAEPVESAALEIVEVPADEVLGSAERAVVAEAEEKRRSVVDGEANIFDAENGFLGRFACECDGSAE